jgi:beta-lactamase regulating signal transducer with metallopeptidase domain
MSAAQTLSSIPLVQPVAWALIHSVWQGGLLALALAAALSLLRGRSPQVRYATALAAFLALPIFVLATAWRVASTEQGSRPAATGRSGAAAVAAGSALPASASSAATVSLPLSTTFAAFAPVASPGSGAPGALLARAGAALRPSLPWLFAAWLCGVVALSLAQLAGWLEVRRWRHRGTPALAAELRAALPRLCQRLGIRRAVTLLESATVAVPAVVGWLRPLVLVPASAFAGLTPQQLELVLAHELAHVRRHDYLVTLLQALVETFLFYHPAAWWMSHQVRREREHCCDDLAVAVCGDRLEYARALAALEGLRTAPLHLAPAVTGPSRGVLLARIRRLIAPAGGARVPSAWFAGALGLALLALSAAVPLFGFAAIPGLPGGDDTAAVRLAAAPSSLARAAAAAGASIPERIAEAGGTEEESAAAATVASSTAEAWSGQWTAERQRDTVRLEMTHHGFFGNETWGESFNLPTSQLVGLTTGSAIRFELRRDAGTFIFTGKFETTAAGAEGAGSFTFQPNPGYAREMQGLGYQVSNDRLLELAIHDVALRFVREIQELGYRDIPLDRLIEFKIHGVTPEFIRALAAHGYRGLPADRLVEFRIHGVSPEFVQGLGAQGYRDVPADRLVEFRIHGVSPEFVRDLAALGYRDVSADRLVEFRIHGVSPEFLRELAGAGYPHVAPEALVSMRIHGVDAAFIRDLAARGYHDLSPDELVSMRIRGPERRARRPAEPERRPDARP